MPSGSDVLGSHPTNCFILVMSVIKLPGFWLARSLLNGVNCHVPLPAVWMIVLMVSMNDHAWLLPILKTCPYASSQAASLRSASTQSSM